MDHKGGQEWDPEGQLRCVLNVREKTVVTENDGETVETDRKDHVWYLIRGLN